MSVMQPMQEFAFYFANGIVTFAHLYQHPDKSWFASQTAPLKAGSTSGGQDYAWVPCPSGATADQAFEMLVERAEHHAKAVETVLSAVDNLNNDEFVKIAAQRQLAPGVEIRKNGQA